MTWAKKRIFSRNTRNQNSSFKLREGMYPLYVPGIINPRADSLFCEWMPLFLCHKHFFYSVILNGCLPPHTLFPLNLMIFIHPISNAAYSMIKNTI